MIGEGYRVPFKIVEMDRAGVKPRIRNLHILYCTVLDLGPEFLSADVFYPKVTPDASARYRRVVTASFSDDQERSRSALSIVTSPPTIK
jgi:hypothetical protein